MSIALRTFQYAMANGSRSVCRDIGEEAEATNLELVARNLATVGHRADALEPLVTVPLIARRSPGAALIAARS